MQRIGDIRVNDNQFAVYKVLDEFGPLPDHALVPMAQHVLRTGQSSSGIRTRRNELCLLGLVKEEGTVKTSSGRTAITWETKPPVVRDQDEEEQPF